MTAATATATLVEQFGRPARVRRDWALTVFDRNRYGIRLPDGVDRTRMTAFLCRSRAGAMAWMAASRAGHGMIGYGPVWTTTGWVYVYAPPPAS